MIPDSQKSRPKIRLSAREDQLIRLAIDGATDAAIAHNLGISEATVSTYWGRIRIKLGPYSRTELVALVLQEQHNEAVKSLREENAQLIQKLQQAAATHIGDQSLYQMMIESAPDATIMVSQKGILLGANDAAHDLFGYTSPELVGVNLLQLVPADFRVAHVVHRDEYMHDHRRRAMGEHLLTPALHRSGEIFPIRASLSAIETSDGLIVFCAIRKA